METVLCKIIESGQITAMIEMPAYATIRELKVKIQERRGIKANKQQLSHGGMMLLDSHSIQFYGINGIGNFNMDVTQDKFTITLRMPRNEETNIKVRETHTVRDLKRKIEHRWGFVSGDVVLLRLFTEMEDDRQLSHYHLYEGCEVEVKIMKHDR